MLQCRTSSNTHGLDRCIKFHVIHVLNHYSQFVDALAGDLKYWSPTFGLMGNPHIGLLTSSSMPKFKFPLLIILPKKAVSTPWNAQSSTLAVRSGYCICWNDALGSGSFPCHKENSMPPCEARYGATVGCDVAERLFIMLARSDMLPSAELVRFLS